MTTLCLFLAGVLVSAQLQLPPLTGPRDVGATSFELIDHSRIDPLAPTTNSTQIPRRLMVSLFYPAKLPSNHSLLAPYCTHAESTVFAAIANSTVFAPLNALLPHCAPANGPPANSTLLTRTYLDARPLDESFPLILFSPGFGGSRLDSAHSLADLASRGWIIASVDHPYDAAAIVYPDGSVVFEQPGLLDVLFNSLPTVGAYLTEIRAADLDFVRRVLVSNATNNDTWPSLPKTARAILAHKNLTRIGLLGGSLGGATAARLLLNGPPYACGANLDGGVYGPVLNTSEPRPFLTFATPGHNSSQDSTWADFFSELNAGKAFWRAIGVNGTVHQSFLDVPVLRDVVKDVGEAVTPGLWGTIGGERLVGVENGVLDAFFGYCVEGREEDKASIDDLVRDDPELFPVE
jgi:pimeloyl-ACP methyl ester carboxylesterase